MKKESGWWRSYFETITCCRPAVVQDNYLVEAMESIVREDYMVEVAEVVVQDDYVLEAVV